MSLNIIIKSDTESGKKVYECNKLYECDYCGRVYTLCELEDSSGLCVKCAVHVYKEYKDSGNH